MKGVAVLVLSAMVFAGCVGSEATPNEVKPTSVVVAPGEAFADAGTLEGVIVDDQSAPVAGAIVGFKEIPTTAMSDEAGAFVIQNLAPGTYTVFVQKLGFTSAAKQVIIGAQETVRATIVIAPVPIAEAYYETKTKAAQIAAAFGYSVGGDSGHGCIQPAVTCQSVASAANHPFEVNETDAAPLAGIVFEASWVPNSALCAKTLRLRLFSPDTGTSPTDTNPGHWTNDPHDTWTITSPVVMRIPRADDGTKDSIDSAQRIELNDGEPLDVEGNWVGRTFPPGRGLTNTPVDFNCFTEQRVDLWFTTFFLDAAPLDFSARPDA